MSGTLTQVKASIKLKEEVIANCWQYLRENFHKLSENNKIKVALKLCEKDMPTKMEGGLALTKMPTVEVDGKELGAEVGDDPSSTDSGHTGEDTSGTAQDQ